MTFVVWYGKISGKLQFLAKQISGKMQNVAENYAKTSYNATGPKCQSLVSSISKR